LFEALRAGGLVVHDPLGKANAVLNFNAQVVGPPPGFGELAAAVEVGLQGVHPDFHVRKPAFDATSSSLT
jgi:hypothetical protein